MSVKSCDASRTASEEGTPRSPTPNHRSGPRGLFHASSRELCRWALAPRWPHDPLGGKLDLPRPQHLQPEFDLFPDSASGTRLNSGALGAFGVIPTTNSLWRGWPRPAEHFGVAKALPALVGVPYSSNCRSRLRFNPDQFGVFEASSLRGSLSSGSAILLEYYSL